MRFDFGGVFFCLHSFLLKFVSHIFALLRKGGRSRWGDRYGATKCQTRRGIACFSSTSARNESVVPSLSSIPANGSQACRWVARREGGVRSQTFTKPSLVSHADLTVLTVDASWDRGKGGAGGEPYCSRCLRVVAVARDEARRGEPAAGPG